MSGRIKGLFAGFAAILLISTLVILIVTVGTETVYSIQGTEPENGTVEGYGEYKFGAWAVLIATPDEGYEFVEWYDESENRSLGGYERYSLIVRGDEKITAIFRLKEFSVRVNTTGEAEITGAGTYHSGDTVTLSALPKENYTFSHWEYKGDTFEESVFTFVVEGNAVIRCVLTGDPCDITIVPGNHIDTAPTSGTYEYGSKIGLYATADEGYVVDMWKSGEKVLGYGSRITYEVRGNAEIYVFSALYMDADFTTTQTGYGEPYTFTCKSNDSVMYSNTWSARGEGVKTKSYYGENLYSMNLDCTYGEDSKGVWTLKIQYPNNIAVEDMRSITITHTVHCEDYEKSVSNTYSAYGWKHSYSNYSLFLKLNPSDYASAKSFSDNWNKTYKSYYYRSSLWDGIVVQNSTIKSVAYSLDAITAGMTRTQKAQCILDFVTYTVNYTSDQSLYGQSEYFATAYGTLYLRKGDCEDSSILFVSLASYCGFKTYLISPPGHMAGGVVLSDTGGNFKNYPGLYYCETTQKDAKVGRIPSSYVGVSCTLETVSVYRW